MVKCCEIVKLRALHRTVKCSILSAPCSKVQSHVVLVKCVVEHCAEREEQWSSGEEMKCSDVVVLKCSGYSAVE